VVEFVLLLGGKRVAFRPFYQFPYALAR